MEEVFQKIGLDHTEAKVYNALFEIGPSTVTEITKRARITRTLGYHVLEKLEWYGLVGRAGGEGKKMKYAVEHPSSLLQFVKAKRKTWDERIVQTEEMLPQLLSVYSLTDKPLISYQQGVQGIISSHDDILETKTEVLSVMDIGVWEDSEFWDWVDEFQKKRNKKPFKERMLLVDARPDREYVQHYGTQLKNSQIRFIKPEKLRGITELGGEIHVYDNKVMIAIIKRPNRMGVIIESSVLSNIMRVVFDLAWETATPAPKAA